jgi:divalent metal cation (Fe/Co/Zn/Cd) transporter
MRAGVQRLARVADLLTVETRPSEPVSRTRRLARLGLVWHGLEAAVAVTAGIVAGSVALVGFGADSLVEAVAGVTVLWRFGGQRVSSQAAERRAQQLIAASFLLVAVYVGIEATRDLIVAARPEVSRVGIALSAVTLVTMPPLARAKARVAHEIGSSATVSESRQTILCAYLSAALLVGLVANAAFGWWWADPVVALLIAGVALREARDAWRGEQCDCCA